MQSHHEISSSLPPIIYQADDDKPGSESSFSIDEGFLPVRYELTRTQAFLRDLFRWSFIIAPPAVATSFVFANILPPTYYGLMNGFTTSSFATIAAFSSAFGRFTHPGDFYRNHGDGGRCNPDHHLGKGFGLTMLKNLVLISTTSAAGLGLGLVLDLYPQDLLLGSISRSILLKSTFTILAATVVLAMTKYALQGCIREETIVEEDPRLHWVQKGWRSFIARPFSTMSYMLMLSAFMAIAGRADLTENPHMQLLALPVDQLITWLDTYTLAVGLPDQDQPELSVTTRAKKIGMEFGKILLAIAVGVAVMEAFAQNSSLALQQCILAWWIGIIASILTKYVSDNPKEIYTKVTNCTSSLFHRCRKAESHRDDSLIITEDIVPQPH